jgi:hypothetical protein
MDHVFGAVEDGLYLPIGVLCASKVERGLFADHILAKELQTRLIRPGVHFVMVYFHDDVWNGGKNGFLA